MIRYMHIWTKKIKSLPVAVRTSILYLLCSILQKGVAFIAVPLYTRLVLPEQYGVYSLYQSWDSVLSIFATLNMWNYLYSNGMLKYERRKDEFTSALIGLSCLLTTILLVIFLLGWKTFLKFSGLPLAALILMFFDFYLRPSYEYWAARQRFEYDVKKYAVSAIFITVSTPIVSICLIFLARKYLPEYTGVAIISGKVLCASLVYLVVMYAILRKKSCVIDKEIWRFALKFNMPLIPHFLSTVILAQSDRIMIGAMCGTDQTAIYSVAYSVASVLLIVNSAVMDVIIPWTYKALQAKDYQKLPYVSILGLVIVAALNLFIGLLAPEIIKIMAPGEYQYAVYIIPAVAISNVFIFMFNLFANIEYFYEETKLVTAASCIAAIANVILNYIFINLYGFIAAGYTTLVCYIFYALSHFCFMKYVLKKYAGGVAVYPAKMLWGIALSSVAIAISIIGLYQFVFVRFFIAILGVAVIGVNSKKFVRLFISIKKTEEFL